MAAVQCLEVFSLRVVPRKSLQYVFHRKPCWLISVLYWVTGCKVEVLGDLEIAEMSPPSKRFRGQGSLFLVKDASLDVSAAIHVPECPAVWPKGKKENACLWSCSTTPHFPQNRHEVVRTFSQTWVNARRYGDAEPTVLNSEATQPTHLSPLFVFWLWHPARSSGLSLCSFGSGVICKPFTEKLFASGRDSLSPTIFPISLPGCCVASAFGNTWEIFHRLKKNVYKITLTPHGFNWRLQPSFKPTSILILCHGQGCVKTENETAGDQHAAQR